MKYTRKDRMIGVTIVNAVAAIGVEEVARRSAEELKNIQVPLDHRRVNDDLKYTTWLATYLMYFSKGSEEPPETDVALGINN